jgi:hypothetical protein
MLQIHGAENNFPYTGVPSKTIRHITARRGSSPIRGASLNPNGRPPSSPHRRAHGDVVPLAVRINLGSRRGARAPLLSQMEEALVRSAAPHGRRRPGPQLLPPRPPYSRSELKGMLRASAETAALALAAVDGGLEDVQRLSPAGVRVDAGHGPTGPKLWSDADEVTLLAAAVAFRERTGRAPRRPDAAALFDGIKGSVSLNIDVDKAYDKLNSFESEFLNGTLGPSYDVRDLCAGVWGAVDVVVVPRLPPDADSGGEDAGEQDDEEGRFVSDEGESDADERRLATERTSKPAPLPRFDAHLPSEGPSASAMDTDVVPTLSPPSRSTKRPFHPQPSVDDDRPGSISSPRRLGSSAEIAGLAQAAAAPRASQTTSPSTSTESATASRVTEPRTFVRALETAPPRGWSARTTVPSAILTMSGATPTRSRSATAQVKRRAIGTRGFCYGPLKAPSPRTSTRPRRPTSCAA